MPIGPFDEIPVTRPPQKVRLEHINELRRALTNIQDAYDVAVAVHGEGVVGTRANWLASLKGPPGASLVPLGSVADMTALNAIANPQIDDVWTVDETERAYAWDGSAWVDIGQFRGPGGMDTELRARVDPGTTGAAGDAYRVTGGGPHFRDPDSVSPLDFGAAGDNTTDDYAAIMNAATRLGSRGGRIDLGGKRYFSAQKLEFSTPVIIDGGTAGMSGSIGGELRFPAGVGGVKLATNAGFAGLANLKLQGGDTSAGAAVGLEVRNGRWSAEKVMVQGFGSHGMLVTGDGAAGQGNANVGFARQVRLISNYGDGLHVEGADANCCTFINVATVFNGGVGFYDNAAGKNTYINPLADQNTGVDFYDDGFGNVWINPYSEGSHDFVIGKGGFGGMIFSGGTFGPPTIKAEDNSGVLQPNAYWAGQRGWVIWDAGKLLNYLTIVAEQGGIDWRLIGDVTGSGQLLLQDATNSKRLMTFVGGATPRAVLEADTVLASGKALRFNSTSGPLVRSGTGTPEGVVSAPVGSLYTRTDGGAGTTMYVKESGTGNTGWRAV